MKSVKNIIEEIQTSPLDKRVIKNIHKISPRFKFK